MPDRRLSDVDRIKVLAYLLRRGDPDLVELHGDKGKPGYTLLHSPDSTYANKIYKLYGQSAVTQDAVDNVKAGMTPQAAVAPGTPLSPHKAPTVVHLDTDHADPSVPETEGEEKISWHEPGVHARQLLDTNLRVTSTYYATAPHRNTSSWRTFRQSTAEDVGQLRGVLQEGEDANGPLSADSRRAAEKELEALEALSGWADLVGEAWQTFGITTRFPHGATSEPMVIDALAELEDYEDPTGPLLTYFPNLATDSKLSFSDARRRLMERLRDIRVAALPFSLDSASRSVRTDFVRKNGGLYVQSMPKDDQIAWVKAWVLRDLDPTNFQDVKDKVELDALNRYNTTQAKIQARRAAQLAMRQAANAAPAASAQPSASPTAIGLDPPDPVIHTSSQNLTFKKVARQRALGGWAEKYLVEDQFGNVWLFKPEVGFRGGKAGAEYRTDMEHAAHLIGNHLGFDSAESRVVTINGVRGQAQRMFTGIVSDFVGGGTNSSIDVTTLTPRELQDVVEEHLLDWILANHDSHIENMLRLNNGTVVGIDKGQAFKYHGKDKLKIDYRPDPRLQTKPNPVDEIYKAIIRGDFDKTTVDNIVRHALQRAARMEVADSKPIEQALADAQKKRPKNSYGDGAFSDPTGLIKSVVARKERLSKDFESFFRDIYKQAGLDFSDDLLPQRGQSLTEGKVEGVYSGLSKALFKDVKRAQVHGVSAMFAGTDLEDGHILFWEELWDRSPVLRGQFTTREEADKRITNWLKQREGKSIGTPVKAVPKTAADLQYEPEWYDALVGVAKNYAHHTATGNYSDRRIQQSVSTQLGIRSALTYVVLNSQNGDASDFERLPAGAALSWRMGSSLERYEKQPDGQWKSTMSSLVVPVDVFLDSNGKTSPSVAWDMPTQLPASVLAEILQDGPAWESMAKEYLQKFQDLENHRASGTKPPLMARHVFVPTVKKPQPVSATSAAPLNIRVERVSNGRHRGVLDIVKGILKVNPNNAYTTQGEMYKVHVDDDIEIEYRPWDRNVSSYSYSYSGIPLGQHGIFRITAKNFNGDPAELDKTFRVIREMGIDLRPAEREDLELLYWRNLYGNLSSRGNKGKYASVLTHVQQNRRSGMSPQQEIALYQDAFATAMKRTEVDNADWRPQFSRQRVQAPDLKTGHPHFYRPDFDLLKMRQIAKSQLPTHVIATGSDQVAKSGSLLSIEERIRIFGQHVGGASTGNQSTGGSNYVFIQFGRQPGSVTFGRGSRGPMVLVNPDVYRRSSSWDLASMSGGSLNLRTSTSHFDYRRWSAGTHNAIHVKNAISYLDDVEVASFETDQQRDEVIKFYRDHGVTEIRGLPIEQRFVTMGSRAWLEAPERAWAAYEARVARELGAVGVRAPARRKTAPTAAGLAAGTSLISFQDVSAYVATLVSQKMMSKGFLNAVKKAMRMNAPITGARFRRIRDVLAKTTPQSTQDSAINSRQKMQILIEKDEIDLDLLHKYLTDSAALASAPPAEVVYVNYKYYLMGGIEQFYARRILGGGYYARQDVKLHRYYLSIAEAQAAGLQ